MLKVGEKAPEFSLEEGDGSVVSLSDFRGKSVVLYFYPRDNTPGCTIEAIDFSAFKKDFDAAGAVVLGVSKDSCASHKKFIEGRSLTIRLLSDPDSEVQKKYDVWRKRKFMGKEFLGTVRSTFLIDPAGVIVKIWDDVKAEGHAAEVLGELTFS